MRDVAVSIGLSELPLHLKVRERANAQSVVVFMPSAVDRQSVNRHPAFARWRWADDFPDSHVLAISDPVMGTNDQLEGTWYLHPEIDVVASIAAVIEEFASRVGATTVVVYGSSLGGFGSLAVASLLTNAYAIAEVPQIDFANWSSAEAKSQVEEFVLGCSLAQHRERHPHQLSVISRFQQAGRIPPYLLLTNANDTGLAEQIEFQTWVSRSDNGTERVGEHELRMVDIVSGHRVLPQDRAVGFIRERL